MQTLARTHTPEAVQALVDALRSPRERVAAATALLDRGWGRPSQQLTVSGDASVIELHLVAARGLVATFAEANGPPPPTTIEARAEGEPGFNLLDAPKPTE